MRHSERVEWSADFRLSFNAQVFSGDFSELLLSGSVAGEASNSARTPDFLAMLPSTFPSPSSQFADDADYLITRRACPGWSMMELDIPANTTSLFDNLNSSLLQGFRPLISSVQNHIISTSTQMRHLLPWKTSQELQRASADIVIVKQIMFLLMNNFAGSDYAAFDSIFEQVKRFSISQMEDILDAIPEPYTSALQQSILTIAIKSNIPVIVEILLGKGMDPNRVTCRFGGRVSAPLDLACKFHRLEVVQILIRHGANPNREANENQGATYHLLHLDVGAVEYPSNTCAIMQCLLMAHATIRCVDLEYRRFWTNEPLVDAYIRCSMYPLKFTRREEPPELLFKVLIMCSVEQSTAATKKILEGWRDSMTISNQSKQALLLVSRRASYQGNSDIVDHIQELGIAPDASCLCEAVGGNNKGLVQKYVRAGIDIHGTYGRSSNIPYAGTLPEDIEPQLREGCSIELHLTTPFAEAIRWRHQHLIEESKNLNHLRWSKLVPVLLAAAEIGNKEMVQQVLRLLEKKRLPPKQLISTLITVAVLGNHESIVDLLLDAGSRPNSGSVLAAILVRNSKLVKLFLDSYIESKDSELAHFAVRWGNPTILNDLIIGGFPINDGRM
ncbi:Ank-2 multi-domain protein [Pyrenophora tritici-repentis]|nr:ankyrin repeat domain-containing protein [Pyrenophora tritici-repentis]KAI1543511.1 Ank-2 multi-domain protein [Pyrenophora tritici-repentis]KAI1565935.1 Ank-2 multi-domain protein [Pyrenophora tritici-repentis]